MKYQLALIVAAVASVSVVAAQSCVALYGQCGGQYYNGQTCCQSGTSCVYVNNWYSQCKAGASSPSPSPAVSPRVSPTTTLVAQSPSPASDPCNWRDDFTSSAIDTNRWNLNNCASLISVHDGVLDLKVSQSCNSDGHGGRIRTTKKYSNFDVTWRVKTSAPKGGVVNAFYTASTGENVNGAQDEIDFEYLMGSSSRKLQTNVYINGNGGREQITNVSFDPSADFHSYRLVWDGTNISWYIDGNLNRQMVGTKQAQYIIMSHWMCDSSVGAFCNDWAGTANWSGTPVSMLIDYVDIKGTCS